MQFPARDYIWLVLLLCLAIGLAAEQTRLQKLAAFKAEATTQERTAYALAEEMGENLKLRPELTEFADIRFISRDSAQNLLKFVPVKYVSNTDERKWSWSATGSGDWDFVLLIFTPLFVMSLIQIYRSGKQASTKPPSLPSFLGACVFSICQMSVYSILAYGNFALPFRGSMPFTGTLCLMTAVAILLRYVHLGELSPAELDDQLSQSGGALWNFRGGRQWLRFQLRDFFWLMLVIGLGCAVYLEQGRARDLSGHRGRAHWWRNAVRSLQHEADQLPASNSNQS